MSKNSINNIQLGLFLLLGLAFLLTALYLIGGNQNLFDRTFKISATFHNVNGLMAGNNVRFAGIDVGTIKSVEIINDSSVQVTMVIKNDASKFIKRNSLASIGTDGLMGNKLVNINNALLPDVPVQDGDVIKTFLPVETGQMLRTLDQTNGNLYEITVELKGVAQKINNSKVLWKLLADTTLGVSFKQSLSSIQSAANNTALFTQDLNGVLRNVRNGKGMVGYLLSDTVSPAKLSRSIEQINEASANAAKVTYDLNQMMDKLKRGEGSVGVLLNDTAFAQNLRKSMINIRISTEKFSENMEAMKHNFLFRGYFKDQEKKQKNGKIPGK